MLVVRALGAAVVIAADVIIRARAPLQAVADLVEQALRQQPCRLAAVQHLTLVTRSLTAARDCSKSAAASGNCSAQERLTLLLLLLLLLLGLPLHRHQW
jgi:BioD-like phosphotransacetylase family protein